MISIECRESIDSSRKMSATQNGSSSSDVSFDESPRKGSPVRRHVGEILVGEDSAYAIVCRHCNREFSFFYEFKQHVEEPCKERTRQEQREVAQSSRQYDDDVFNKRLLPMEKALKLIQFRNPNEVRQLIEGSDYVKTGGKMKCVRCDKSIKCKRELRNHLTVVHGDKRKKNYNCPLCTRQFLLVEYVQRHLLNAHNVRYTIEMIRMSQPIEEQENGGWQSKLMVDSLKEQITLMTNRQAQLEQLLASGNKYSQVDIDKIVNDAEGATQCSTDKDNIADNHGDDNDDNGMVVYDDSEISASYSVFGANQNTNEFLDDASTIKTEDDLCAEDFINI